jgi:flagellar L-ring protein FlgH
MNFRNQFHAKAALCALVVAIFAVSNPANAAWGKKSKKKDPPQESLTDYLAHAKQWSTSTPLTIGSLWTPDGRLAEIGTDDKAHRLGDVITIQLVEATTSAQQGSLQTQRTITASSGISELFGTPGAASGIQNLFSPNSSQVVNGKGQTSLATSLQVTIAGTVVEVLPGGQLVVQAVHQVDVSNEKQTLVLRGIARPTDVSSSNIILSTQLAHMDVHLTGSGAMSQGTKPMNPVTRWALAILGF